MTVAWVEYEHLPTRKLAVQYDGTRAHARQIVALVNDPRRAYLAPLGELVVVQTQGEFVAHPSDYVVLDGDDVYPMPADRFHRQYIAAGEQG